MKRDCDENSILTEFKKSNDMVSAGCEVLVSIDAHLGEVTSSSLGNRGKLGDVVDKSVLEIVGESTK